MRFVLVSSAFLGGCDIDHGLTVLPDGTSGDRDTSVPFVKPEDPCRHFGKTSGEMYGYTWSLPVGPEIAFSAYDPVLVDLMVTAGDEVPVSIDMIGIVIFAPEDNTSLAHALAPEGDYVGEAAVATLRGSVGSYTLNSATAYHLDGNLEWVFYEWREGPTDQNVPGWEPSIPPWTINPGGVGIAEFDFPELSTVLPRGYTCAEMIISTPYPYSIKVSLYKE